MMPGDHRRAVGGASAPIVERWGAFNAPRPIEVRADADGDPVAVRVRAGWVAVAAVADEWRIAVEWWRAPIRRRYLLLSLADGRTVTIFRDGHGGGWFAQSYPDRRGGAARAGAPASASPILRARRGDRLRHR
jgi:hypothetical protein